MRSDVTARNEYTMSKLPTDREIIISLITEVHPQDWGWFLKDHLIRVQAMADYASRLSIRAAGLSTYLDCRGALGCGDHGHTEALEEAKKTRKKVRKALGYTYPGR